MRPAPDPSALRCLLLAATALALLRSAQAQLPLMDTSAALCAECPLADEDGSVVKNRPVCGTDGRTYESRCQLDRAKCQGHPVEVAHRGKCPDAGRCRAQRALAQTQARKYAALGIFVPECKEDGRYFEVQCHGSTGYCWCVDEAGKPIPGSSVRYKKPNCLQQGCSNGDRSTFNKNLIDIFKSEWSRIPAHAVGVPAHSSDPLMDTEQKRVIQWKFTQLDLNGDQTLRRKEVRDLRRLVKKIVRPRPCARTFIKYCDLDQDKVISRSEWSACLGVDTNISFRLFMSLNSDEQLDASDAGPLSPPGDNHHDQGAEDEDDLDDKDEEDDDDDQEASTWPTKPSSLDLNPSDSRLDSKEEDTHDCGSARRVAQENQRQAPSGSHYIPECSPDGTLYMEAQCHQENCWCVGKKNGQPIRGTATKSVKPDCQATKQANFKGCSFKKKKRFVEEYVDYLTQEAAEAEKNVSQSVAPAGQTTEQLARLKHSQLDINKNQVLDRKEWKLFRKDWKMFRKVNKKRKKLRKCWRNFPRFCDKNNDSRVTMQEWLSCTMDTPGPGQESTDRTRKEEKSLKDQTKRTGPNPFHTILKSE